MKALIWFLPRKCPHVIVKIYFLIEKMCHTLFIISYYNYGCIRKAYTYQCFLVLYQPTFHNNFFFQKYCIDMVYPQCMFSHIYPVYISMQNVCHKNYIEMVYSQCVFAGVLPESFSWQNICHKCCIDMIYLQCVFFVVLLDYFALWAKMKSNWDKSQQHLKFRLLGWLLGWNVLKNQKLT